MKTRILKLTQIEWLERLYPRNKVNYSVVDNYVRAMNNNSIFPNIFVAFYKGKYIGVDGRHRFEAYSERGEEFIRADIQSNFPNEREIFLSSIRMNQKHGLKLSTTDKLRITHTLKDMKVDVVDISKLVNLNVSTIEKAISLKVTKNVIFDKMRKGGKSVIKEHIKEKEKISIVDERTAQIEELKTIYYYFKTGKFDLDDTDVYKILLKIKKILRQRFPKLFTLR